MQVPLPEVYNKTTEMNGLKLQQPFSEHHSPTDQQCTQA